MKKWIGRLHMWLGLSCGLVVFITGLTGAIYCFAPELESFQPYRLVQEADKKFLPPSQIRQIAGNSLPGKNLQRIYYDHKNKAVMVLFSKKEAYSYSVFINPYSGEVLKVRDNDKDFLSVVLQIHRTLLIPYGREIIRWSTVVFVFMLLSGIILWWPKNRRTAKKRFRIMWRASPKRLNYDLHTVLGFYVTWVIIFTAFTGLIFAFEGFADFMYRVTGSGHSIVQKKPPLSDTTVATQNKTPPVDVVWETVGPDLHQKYATIMFVLPAANTGPILVRANPGVKTLYKTDFRYFDQYSGREIPGAYVWGRYQDTRTIGDNLKRMNYDIHTGAIYGLPGRIAVFFASLIAASLPISGFFFLWGRKHKRKITR
ncbi:PepSY domain-containing protein [Sediminibacterium sp.]|uniref:PepSY-associated TM helix domain-containing protein n=1 Tax=Sediminibacterium sp. TaxID=1917865 RepID=UPI00272F2EFC|nr:PepSY-associated TM helix domain-containing protein [Sediminibacterium sp.]MDP2421486.1 PepSY-associated TM helix domain-containing protein [Sediminibacterium sp.]